MSIVDEQVRETLQSDPVTVAPAQSTNQEKGSAGVAFLRVTLGFIILATWWSNVSSDPNFYSAEGLRGFFDWVFLSAEEGGNGASFTVIGSLFDSIDDAGLLGIVGFAQTVMEFLIGVGLLLGIGTRFFSALATLFFAGLFLTYFGGEEWIGTYILLIAASVTTFLSWGGRTFGVDRAIAAARGESPGKLLW